MVQRLSVALIIVVLCLACEGRTTRAPLNATRSYTDTLAHVGRANEENPLFLYAELGMASLVDDSTVVFSDQRPGGRVVIANMVSGEGWQIESPSGAGPGEFDGHTPTAYPWDGDVHLLTLGGRHSVRTKSGVLIAERRFPPDSVFGFRAAVRGSPVGLVGERIVSRVRDAVDWEDPTPQEIGFAVRIFNTETHQVVDIRDGMPSQMVEVVQNEDGSRTTRGITEQEGVALAARGDLIVHGTMGQRMVIVRDEEGRVSAEREISHPIANVKIDGSGRIWVEVVAEATRRGPRWIVFDRRLNELFRTVVGMQDSYNDVVLALVRDRAVDLWSLALIRRDQND